MFSFLLLIIYLSFISLGLPDALLGSAWPIMHEELKVPLSYSGSVYMLISCCTILSSLKSESLNRRFGTGKITAFSVLLTALAIFGFSMSRSFYMLLLFAIPYGLGAGSVDAALNHYVALHYSSRHMNWLHCMWGIGASIGPYIMGFVLQRGYSWSKGYLLIGILQAGLTFLLFLSLGLWKEKEEDMNDLVKVEMHEGAEGKKAMSFREILRIPGAKECIASFFFYCAIEQTIGLWSGSFMVYSLRIDAKLAASFVALFYFGITFGRFLAGIFSAKWKDEELILGGITILFLGIALLFPAGLFSGKRLFGMELRQVFVILSLLFMGLGCAPIYPAIIHSTPYNFGAENTSALIGKQMASAYIGSLSLPPIFGVLAKNFGTGLFPFYAVVLGIAMLYMYKQLLKKTKEAKRKRKKPIVSDEA
ncbi:MFS transporter [Oribacterium parvum]|uniref:MFS transporter n=1 Tax=Oribacterium parvum TaxID=1501329 RepID=UPI0028DC21E9|nr:MFS transporter [Oribacterium parvum]